MFKYRSFLIYSALILFCLSAQAQQPSGHETPDTALFSPSLGQIFYEIALETADSNSLEWIEELNAIRYTPYATLEQAIIFLTATMNLDNRANYVLADMISYIIKRDAYSTSSNDIMSTTQYDIQYLLGNYVNGNADLEVATKAIRYLLEKLNSREEREKLLKELLRALGGKNAALSSELATLLGLLNAEKPDPNTAQSYFMKAFNGNKYNKLAFAKLAELAPEQIVPATYLEHLRLALGENPLEMDAALGFAQYAEQLELYQTAADAYEYCADLFSYLNGQAPNHLPAYIYLPWAISNYNTQRNQHKCLEIAKSVRQSGQFNLFLEAIAGKAAAKIGDTKQANQIFQAAEEKAKQLLTNNTVINNQLSIINSLAWFYCFADTNAISALNWANKAYSIEPNSATTAAILAYSLVLNGQIDWAETIIDNYPRSQIADLTLAQIQLAQEQKGPAIKTLKSAIALDPGSLEAERAKQILAQHEAEYIPPTDPDIILTVLRNSFAQVVVPAFTRPQESISVQLNIRGSKFSYGSKFGGTVVITNNSAEPLIISDDGLFKGNIRIDAGITGDISRQIPNMVSFKIHPPSPIKPGHNILIPVRLITGPLRHLLLSYPQASLDIEFTVYLDPVTTTEGKLTNRLGDIEPASVVVNRQGVELAGRYLRNRLNTLSKGRQGQKIRTAQLFVGLLAEQQQMANREPLYKLTSADWIPDLLKSALLHNLVGDDWVVKVHTMAAMLSLQLDYELINAVAKNLNDTHWPARMMAIFLLARNQDSNFGKVLDWTVKYDSSKLVRDMAIALGAAPPEVKAPTDPNDSEEQSQNPDANI